MTVPDANAELPQGQEAGTETPSPVSEQQGDTGTPQENAVPWAQYLEPLPESVRPLVEPVFKDWDASVTKKFQSLHSEYEPYKQIISDYEPDALSQAIAIATAMEANPQEFVQQVIQAYGLTPEQGTANSTEVTPEDTGEVLTDEDRRFKALEDMVGQLAQAFLGEREQQTMAQQQQELENTLSTLKSKHGEYDEVYVLGLIGQGMEPEKAVLQFKQTVEQYAQQLNAPQQQAPAVVSANGGYPTRPVTPEDLASSKDTRNLVAQMLQQAAEAAQG